MRDYGKVHTSFWSSATTKGMSDDGRILALYLLTSPHSTLAGVFRLPDGYACEDLGWTSARVAKGFAELLSKGFANRCETTKWVWVVKHLDWNPPENPNQRKSAAKLALSIPSECGWKQAFMRVCGELLGIEDVPLDDGSGTVTKPLLNQEQEQEQKQESGRASRLPADWVLPEEWEEWARGERPDLDPTVTACRFRDFWIAKPGKDGRKTDWQATWRNWVRNERATVVPLKRSSDPFAGAR